MEAEPNAPTPKTMVIPSYTMQMLEASFAFVRRLTGFFCIGMPEMISSAPALLVEVKPDSPQTKLSHAVPLGIPLGQK
jgi:hypothetical protein